MPTLRYARPLATFAAIVAGSAVATLVPAVAAPLGGTAPDPLPRVMFVARDDVPFDSLAVGPVAALLGAPIVITAPNPPLHPAAATTIEQFAPALVIIAGGEAAISLEVEHDIEDACSCPADRAAGPSRNDTAAAVVALLEQYGLGRPLVTGTQVVGDTWLGGTAHLEDLTIEDTGKVANLNADRLDGLDSSAFARVGTVTGYTHCTHADFDPQNSGASDYYNDGNGRGLVRFNSSTSDQSETFECGIDLPANAHVVRVDISVNDNDAVADQNIECHIYRNAARPTAEGPAVDLGSAATTGAPGASFLTIALDDTVTADYTISIWCSVTKDEGVGSATVEYEYVGVVPPAP